MMLGIIRQYGKALCTDFFKQTCVKRGGIRGTDDEGTFLVLGNGEHPVLSKQHPGEKGGLSGSGGDGLIIKVRRVLTGAE